jgi:single-stranded-DNA-specific exonuclease
VLEARYRWEVRPLRAPDPDLLTAAQRLGLSPRVAALLAGRGVGAPSALEQFLGPAEAGLLDPALLPDAGRFAERVEQARARSERVMVFGDFDADGLTGLAIMVRVLRRLGIETEPYVPSRLDEGHGLSLAAIAHAATNAVSLIVTVDCGTVNVAEVQAARDHGIDVLITDHHRVPARLPAALAIVNAHRPDSHYPDANLSGSGIAFKLGQLLLAGEPGGPAEALGLADLATIGTVADVAPVLGENRSIARLGLERLRRDPRPGLAALLRRAGVAARQLDLEDVAFVVAPRLNAAGRVGEALDAARLLLADDPAEAEALAERLEAANGSRRELMRQAIAEARVSVDAVDGAPATIVRGPWPVGIVGLVAGRLADERGVPAIVGAELGEVVRASCRGDGALHLAAALESCEDLLLRHGGHAAAAGFEIPAGDWEPFRERFLALAAALPPPGPPSLTIDLDLAARAVDYALVRDLGRLAPCGPGHPEPLIVIRDVAVVRSREATGGHSQLTVRRDPDVLDAIAFGWPELARQVAPGDRLDLVARIGSRQFGGFESIQLDIQDAAVARASIPVVVAVGPVEGATSSAGTLPDPDPPSTGGVGALDQAPGPPA